MSESSREIGRFLKHSGIYAIGNALNRFGALLLLPVYTRYLSPTEYGVLESLYLISTVVSGLLGVGIAHATLRFYFDYEKQVDRNSVVSTNLIASLCISVAGVCLVAAAGPLITSQFLPDQNVGAAFYWMLVTIIFELASQVGLAYARATEKSLLFIGVSFAKLLIQLAANSFALVVMGSGVEGVLMGNALAVISGCAVLSYVTLRECGLHFDFAKFKPVLHYSIPLLWSSMVGIVSVTSDRLLLQKLVSLEALGIYALALRISKVIADLVGEPVNRAYGAFRFTIMQRNDAGLIQARIVRYLAVLLAMLALFVALVAGEVIRLLTAPSFWEAARYVPLLVPAAALSVLVYPLQSGIYYQKQSHQIFQISLARCAIGIVLGFVAISAWGITGACVAVLLVSITTAVHTHVLSQRHFHVRYDNGKLALLAALYALATLLGYLSDSLPRGTSLACKAATMLAFMACIVPLRLIEPDEIRAAIDALRNRFVGSREGAK